jgi:hypothetical protein
VAFVRPCAWVAESGNSRQGEIGEVRPCAGARRCVDPVGVRTFGGAARTTAADRSEHAAGPDRAGGGAEQLRVREWRSGGILGSVWAHSDAPRRGRFRTPGMGGRKFCEAALPRVRSDIQRSSRSARHSALRAQYARLLPGNGLHTSPWRSLILALELVARN